MNWYRRTWLKCMTDMAPSAPASARGVAATRALSWKERWVAGEAWLKLAWAALLLRTPFCTHAIQRPAAPATAADFAIAPATLEYLVNAAACHHVKRMECLEKAVALRWMLLRRGFPAQIAFGVQKSDDSLDAHAWVESPALQRDATGDAYVRLHGPAARN